MLDVGRRSEILLVTNGNVFLEKVLSLLPTGDVSRVAAAPLPRPWTSDQYDVVVFDGYVPDVLPRGNVLIVNPSESALFTIEGEVRRPTIRELGARGPAAALRRPARRRDRAVAPGHAAGLDADAGRQRRARR